MSRNTRFSKSMSNFPDDSQDIILDTLGLTAAEIQQLQNINSSAISSTEWSYLAGLNQPLSTSDQVVFAQVSVAGKIQMTTNDKLYLTNNNASHYINYNGGSDGPSLWGTGGCRFGYISGGNETGVAEITSAGYLPVTTATFNLGSASKEWSNIYLVNSPTVSSDENLKEDIQTLNLGLDIINKIEPIKYKYNKKKKIRNNDTNEIIREEQVEDNCVRYGFSAQELKRVLPKNNNVVVENEDGTLSIRPMELIGIMWKAIQELSKK